MNSPTISQNKKVKGFTLIEVIVVIGIIGFVLFASSAVDLNYYSRELKASEVSVLVSSLQKARSRAMNNVGREKHGVYLDDPDGYIIFRGSSYSSTALDNESIPKNPNITLTSSFDAVIFEQLSGDSSEVGDITLSDGTQSHIVTLESGGLITW